MCKISIIIPVYNVEKYLEKCIESLLIQTMNELEFIFVNDGSTDNSNQILEKYSKLDRRITVINIANKGVSEARNIGILNSKGKYIGFVDPDDYIESNTYEIMYKKLIDEEADLVFCNVVRKNINGNDEYLNLSNSNNEKRTDIKEHIGRQLLVERFNGYCWNKIYKRNIIEQFNIKFRANITMYEDFLFNLDYLLNAKKVVCVEDYLYNYIIRKNSATNIIHFNQFEVIEEVYKKIEYCSNIWRINKINDLKLINEKYSEFPYKNSKEKLLEKDKSNKERIANVNKIVNSELTKKIRNEIRYNNIKVSLKMKIFYYLLDNLTLEVYYLMIMNYISRIKKKLQRII